MKNLMSLLIITCIPATLLPMVRGTSMFKNYRPTIMQKRTVSDDIRWKVINRDVKAIGRRMGIEIEGTREVSTANWYADPVKKIVYVQPGAWQTTRLAAVAPYVTHEASHIALGHIRFRGEPFTYHMLQTREREADMTYSLVTGVAQEMARNNLREAQSNKNFSFTECGGNAHPALLERARYMMLLHKKYRSHPGYLEGRFWKLNFILDSYAYEHKLRKKAFFAPVTADVSDDDVANFPYTSHYLAVPKKYREMIDAWFTQYECMPLGLQYTFDKGYFKHSEGLDDIYDCYINEGSMTSECREIIKALRNLAAIKQVLHYTPEEAAAIMARMPEKEYQEFIQELRACIQQLRKRYLSWIDIHLGKNVVDLLYKAQAVPRKRLAPVRSSTDVVVDYLIDSGVMPPDSPCKLMQTQMILLNKQEENYIKMHLTEQKKERLSHYSIPMQRDMLMRTFFAIRESQERPLCDMRLD